MLCTIMKSGDTDFLLFANRIYHNAIKMIVKKHVGYTVDITTIKLDKLRYVA